MYFEFACSKCQKKLKVREENIGGKVRCPHCHTTQVVEGPSTVDQESPFNFVINEQPPAAAPSVVAAGAPAINPSISTAVAPQPAPAPSRTAAHGGHHQASSATEVSPWLTGLVGFGMFIGIYLLLFPLRGKYLGDLFWKRGWVQFAETICFTWSLAILFFKWRKLSMQQDSMLFDLLPTDVSKDITVKSVPKFAGHIQSLPVQAAQSFLVNRVIRGLEHFRILKNSSEVAGRLSTQSDVDANAVDSSYALIKVFVWAIPILGFIGTVQGIGDAVASFSKTMENAADVNALKDSFGLVTSGLGTAFDTTLLALILSMFIMFPMTSLQKSEQDLLNWVDEYCNENLLKRLKDDGGPPQAAAAGIDSKALQAAVDAALTPHHAELKAWSKKLEGIGESLNQQVAQGWSKTDEQLAQRHAQVIKQLQKSVETTGELTDRLKTISEKQSATMTELAERTIQAQSDVGAAMQQSGQSMQHAAESVQRYFGALEEGLGTLNRLLGDLGQKQVVVQVQRPPAPAKSGWRLFGRGR
jgi:biopolymer transport protein ExbB/TolQ/DNA-directed RNA polymerase subunit RPC12/RpoP